MEWRQYGRKQEPQQPIEKHGDEECYISGRQCDLWSLFGALSIAKNNDGQVRFTGAEAGFLIQLIEKHHAKQLEEDRLSHSVNQMTDCWNNLTEEERNELLRESDV